MSSINIRANTGLCYAVIDWPVGSYWLSDIWSIQVTLLNPD